MKKIIGVVSGGYTSERGISQKSGRVVFEALLNTPFECYHVDIAQEAWTVRDANGTQHEINKSDFSLLVNGENKSFDCVVNMIHGAPGENGQLAGYFELLNLPHTSCSSAMAALTYDKRNCLAVTDSFGIPSAKRMIFNEGDSVELDEIINTVGLPCFVKANRAGSSFGVYKVSEKTEFNSALEGALKEDNELLIEAALEGREITVGVLERKGKIEVLPITEIISENDFFDYEAKYEGKSQEITPAKLPLEWKKAAKKMAEKIYKTMGLRGITRTEFIFVDGVPHLLEINTIPGMTLQSIIPQQAEAAGISMEDLLTDLIETSISKKT